MDTSKIADRITAALLKEAAPGVEHERLVAELSKWAAAQGFSSDISDIIRRLLKQRRPDVTRTNPPDSAKVQVFIGDAKDSSHETALVPASAERVRGYLKSLRAMMAGGVAAGGCFALATDDSSDADGWQMLLSIQAAVIGLKDHLGNMVSFQKQQVDPNTYIVFGRL